MADEENQNADPAINLSEWGFDDNGESGGNPEGQGNNQTPNTEPAKPADQEPSKPKEPEAKVKFTESKASEAEGGNPSVDESEPTNLDEKQLANWKGLRQAKEEALVKATALERTHLSTTAELEALKKTHEAYQAQHSEDTFKELRSKVEDFENKIRLLSVDDAPEVKAAKDQVSFAKDALATKLKAALPELAGDVETLLALPASARDAQINEALAKAEAGLPVATAINVALNELDKAGNSVVTAKEAAAQSGADYQAQQAQAEVDAANQRAVEQNEVLGEILQAAAHPETGLPEFRMVEGNEEHNAQVKERMAAVRNTLTGDISFQEAATEAVFAQAGRTAATKEAAYQKTIADLTTTVETYKNQISQLTGAEPGSAGTANAGASVSKGDQDFTSAVMGDMADSGFVSR